MARSITVSVIRLAALLALGSIAPDALAQTAAPNTTTRPRNEGAPSPTLSDTGTTVPAGETGATLPAEETVVTETKEQEARRRKREEDPYAPLGVRVGSFLVFPEIEMGTIYTDNLFLTRTDRKSDHALALWPGLTFRSTWSRHELSGELKAFRSYFHRFESEDNEEYNAALRGRLDITRRTKLEAEFLNALTQESRDSSDFPEGASSRADIQTMTVAVKGSHTFNRLTLSLRGSVEQEDFDDAPLEGGGTFNNDDRDNKVNELRSRASYEFRPGMATFIEGSVNERKFRQTFDDDGIRRGSTGWTTQGGLAFELSRKLVGEIAVGYARQTPDDATQEAIDGIIFNGALTWRPTALTTIKFTAESEIDETTFSDASGSIVRFFEVSAEHKLRRNLIVGAALGYGTDEIISTQEMKRDLSSKLSLEYLLNRSVALKGEYTRIDSDHDFDEQDFVENRFRIGVVVRR